MKLLIVTQVVDEQDPVLGFFCNWLRAFSEKCEHIEVICLKQGIYNLPSNVSVHSLGKERGKKNRLLYLLRFGWFIWTLRRNYDRVLVHMNPEYVLLAALDWWVMGKPVALWYNHPNDDWRFKLAAHFAHKIFYTSAYAASAALPRAKQMPVGIDTDLFTPLGKARQRTAIYMQGRVAPSKNVQTALEALALLRKDVSATLTLVGPEDVDYGKQLRKQFIALVQTGALTFAGSRPNSDTPGLFNSYGVAVNLAAAGHFDKSVFEAMACETPVVVSSKAFVGLIPDAWIVPERNPEALTAALKKVTELKDADYHALGKQLRAVVVLKHSLPALAEELIGALA